MYYTTRFINKDSKVKKPTTYINKVQNPRRYISQVKKPTTYINKVHRSHPISKFNKINILIRNSYRPTTFRKCIQSILKQNYTNYRIIMCYDDDRCMEYLSEYRNHKNIALFKVTRESKGLYYSNLYCNHLLDKVRDGWILFLDDDNMLAQSDSLKKMNNQIKTENDIIFWKVKLGEHIIFPNIYDIQLGEIDITGFCFHSKYKKESRWLAENGSEFYYVNLLLKKHRLIRRAYSEILTQTVLLTSVDPNYSYLFHKYNLGIAKPEQPMIYSIMKEEQPFDNPLVAHLHCYNIDQFFDIYGEILETLLSHFKMVVTYSIGTKVPKQLTCLLVENRGMDIGGKFCVIDYLQDKNYTHILFLHSKSNPERRARYFSLLIENLEEIIEEREEYDGVFPDMKWEIEGGISRNKRGEEIHEVNHLYRNQLLDYLEIEDRKAEFIEGNVYFLTREVSEWVFGDLALYNILNRPTDFDYNYTMNKYGVRGEPAELFQQFGKGDIPPGENYGNIEQSFERIVFNCCERSRVVENIIKPIILIDCQPLQHEIRGIGRYGVNLVNTLIEYTKDYKILLLINNFIGKELLNHIELKNKASFIECHFNNIENPEHPERNVYYNDKEKIHEQTLASFINTINPFIYLNVSEFDRRKVALNRSLLKNQNIKTYCILHDLIPIKLGYLKYKWDRKYIINYNKQLDNIKSYTNQLSNSLFTKKDCQNILNNIIKLGTGVYKTINKNLNDTVSKNILHKFNIFKKYIFVQSAYDSHKGFDFIVEKYKQLPEWFQDEILLVIGSYPTYKDIKSNNLYHKNLIITGYLSYEELSALHKEAWLFIFPSRYEGFGIPPVEAWWHNKPVIVANNTSLIEVMNNNKFMFNHNDNSINNLILNLYNNKELYNECIEHGIKQREQFSWFNIYNNLINIIKLKISITVLTKNNAKWLTIFFKYMNNLELEYTNILEFEYFILENNSTDNTVELVRNFMKSRKGKFISENIIQNLEWKSDKNMNRGLWMNFLRNKLKKASGLLSSDYTIILDSDCIFKSTTLSKLIVTINSDSTIAQLSGFCKSKNDPDREDNKGWAKDKWFDHYFDTLPFIYKNNSYIKNDNTCLFDKCERCKEYRKTRDNLSHIQPIVTSGLLEVESAFGSMCIVPTKYYNKCNYDETLFMKEGHICEHVSFNKQLSKFGKIVVDTNNIFYNNNN